MKSGEETWRAEPADLPPSAVSAFYDGYWGATDRPAIPTPPRAVARLMRATIPRGSSCLDVGCGNGKAGGLTLSALGCGYVGVDVSPTAVAAARAQGLDARLIRDGAGLPFEENSFDAVVSMEVVEHLLFPLPAVEEMMRVLKPGGVLLITTPNVAYWRRRIDLLFGRWNPFGYPDAVARPFADPHVRFFTVGALGRLLREVGCEGIVIRGHGGSLLADLPVVGKRFRKPEASPVYRWLEGRDPSIFGCFINAIGRKPATSPRPSGS